MLKKRKAGKMKGYDQMFSILLKKRLSQQNYQATLS